METQAVPSVDHRGGYRDPVRPKAPPTPVPSGAPGLDDLRRSMLGTTVVRTVLAVFGGPLLMAVVVQLTHAPSALVCAAAAPIALLWLTARRRRIHRALGSADEVLSTGQLVRSRWTGWAFVAEDGTRFALFPCAARDSWQRGGPHLARVVRSCGAAVAWAPLPIDEAEEVELRQGVLDRHFGVTPAERTSLSRGRIPERLRMRAGLVAAMSLLPIVVCSSLLVTFAWHEFSSAFLVVGLIAAHTVLLIGAALPFRGTGGDRCGTSEGWTRPWTNVPANLHRLHVREMALVLSRSAQAVVEPGQDTRAYYCPRSRAVLAVEHVAGSPWPPPPRSADELAPAFDPVLDEFRRRFY